MLILCQNTHEKRGKEEEKRKKREKIMFNQVSSKRTRYESFTLLQGRSV